MNYYENQTYYDFLGLPKNGKRENGEQVSLESIQKARDRMKFGVQNDRYGNIWDTWSKIDEAYDVLSDPERRREYDQYLERKVFNSMTEEQLADRLEEVEETLGDEHLGNGMESVELDELEEERDRRKEMLEENNEYSELTEEQLVAKLNEVEATLDNERYYAAHLGNGMESVEIDELEEKRNKIKKMISIRGGYTTPEITPTTPEVGPTTPEVEPTTPEVEPTTPEVEPTTPEVEPTTPEVEPTAPEVAPTTPDPKFMTVPIKVDKESSKKLIKKSNKLSKISGIVGVATAGFVVGTLIFPGIVGVAIGGVCAIVTPIAINKISKLKLQKKGMKLKIKKVETEESKLIEETNQKIENEIYQLLSEPHNNYKLEIVRIRYENQVKLLEARIAAKLNETPKKGFKIKYKLELSALVTQLETAKKNLERINKQINKYKGKTDIKENSLAKKNNEISDNIKKLEEAKNPTKKQGENADKTIPTGPIAIKKLEIKQSSLIKRRDKQAKKFKLVRDFVGKVKDGAMSAWDFVRNTKNLFISDEKLDKNLNKILHGDNTDSSDEVIEEDEQKIVR